VAGCFPLRFFWRRAFVFCFVGVGVS
jgi:hypothetical protein